MIRLAMPADACHPSVRLPYEQGRTLSLILGVSIRVFSRDALVLGSSCEVATFHTFRIALDQWRAYATRAVFSETPSAKALLSSGPELADDRRTSLHQRTLSRLSTSVVRPLSFQSHCPSHTRARVRRSSCSRSAGGDVALGPRTFARCPATSPPHWCRDAATIGPCSGSPRVVLVFASSLVVFTFGEQWPSRLWFG